jgi:hypothetical protein
MSRISRTSLKRKQEKRNALSALLTWYAPFHRLATVILTLKEFLSSSVISLFASGQQNTDSEII